MLRQIHHKRQRNPEDALTIAATTAATTRRVRTTAAADAETVAVTTTTPTTRAARTTRTTAAVVPTTSAVLATTPLAVSSSASPAAGVNDASSQSSSSTSSGKTIGIAVGIVAVVVLLAAGLGFFFWRRHKKNKAGLFGVGAGKREKEEDERSFIGGSQKGGSEKQAYGMSDLDHSYGRTPPDYNPPVFANNNQQQGFSSGFLPQQQQQPPQQFMSTSAHPYATQQQPYQVPTNGFGGPPSATMMHAPATRLSVQNPYNAAAQQQLIPPAIVMNNGAAPQPAAEGEGPFADPEWEGKVFKVVRTFEPTQGDELVIVPGDRMQIMVKYDDDWCLGYNLDREQPVQPGEPPIQGLKAGVFPFNCVEQMQGVAPTQPTSLQRAPTLPPVDTGSRVSTTFFSSSAPAEAPVTKGSGNVAAARLSSSSSLNHESSMLDEFPPAPGAGVKRTSSLLASKDADLFVQLGKALNDNNADELR